MRSFKLLVLAVGITILAAIPARAQMQIASQDGKQTLKFGILLQPQGEWIDTADGAHTTQNLFIRRLRLLFGGKLNDKVSYFVETDTPNLGKAGANGVKNDVSITLQDAFLTYSFSPQVMIDGGMLLMPLSHNSQQGATTLLPIDYAPYSFLASTPTGSRVGRDYGAQLRAYLLKNHLEFRGAVTQGVRGTDSKNPFRATVRAVYYVWDAETAFFYTGTTFGKKKILAIGGSWDAQVDYQTTAGDVYFDYPIGKAGDAITAQADFIQYDGGKLISTLPQQDTTHFEAGYYFHSLKLGPFIQYNQRNYDDPSKADEKYSQLGLAWWASGHNFNVKLGYGIFEKTGAKDQNQLLLQAQLYFY
jgi:hypothetical protein